MLEQTIDPSRKIIYFVDDAFGTPTLSKNAVEIWVKLYDKIESFVSEEKMMMVLASRKLVLMKAKEMGMDKYCSKYPQSVIDLTDHSYCLTDTEKRRMVANHCEGVGLFPMQLLQNISTYSPGFPLMCKLYANNPRLRKNAQFFHNPTVVLQKDINDLLRNDPTAFCVLVLMVLYDGKLPVECLDIEEEDAIDERKLEVVVNSYGLDRSSALVKMGKSISVLQGVYIEEHEDTYVFLHDSIFDSVCIAFGKKHPKEILKIVSSNFIAQRIRTENTVQAENEDDLDVIILKKSKLKYLAGRWIREITAGDIRHAINNPAFQDEAMTKTFIVEIGKLTFAEFERLVGSVENGKNFVEFLIDEGHTAIAEYLLQLIKDNSLLDFQLSPKSFHNAIGKRNFDIVKLMLDFGADPTITTRPLKINGVHMAAKTGDAQILQLMLEFCDAKSAESGDSSGLLPIHYACQSSSLPCVELLVSKSSNYNCKDGDGKLPIHYAARAGSLECVKFLNDNGCPLHSTDFSGQTLLHLAALNGNVTLITYLLQNGCNPNITDVTSSTPLMYACQNGCSEAIPILIKCGANVNFHNRQRKYPIHMAAEGCHPDDNAARDCIQSLLLAGADPNVEDDQHKTALHYACAWSFDHRYDCVFVLIEAQSNINIPDASKMTPLMYACTSGSFNCATLLVMKGANPECEGSRRNKPIHLACANGNIEIVKLLQNKSVNIKATNEDGRQPIHFASQYGNEEVVCFLIWNGVDINATDNFGKTPLHYACKWGRGKTVKLLMQLEANPDVKDIENNLPCNLIPEWSMDSSLIRKFLSNSTNTF